jgi:hypothetical protein
VDLDGHEEENVPQHGVGKTLPGGHIISESFGDKLVAVGGVAEGTDEDRENGAGEGAKGKLFDVFVAGLVAGGEAEKGDRDRQQPQPLPQQGLWNKQFFNFEHKNVKFVENLWHELGDDGEDQDVVREDAPLETVLVNGTGKK